MTRRTIISTVLTAVLSTAWIALAVIATGCSDDSSPRSVVSVETINEGQVLDSDVYNNGSDQLPGTEDDYIIEDQVAVVIQNRPHDIGLEIRPNGPFGAVVFDRYEVRFSGEETLSPLFGAIHLRVLSGGTGTGIVTVVPAGYKSMPPLLALRTGGEMFFECEVTLIGTEEDSKDEVRAIASIPVHCANWADTEPD